MIINRSGQPEAQEESQGAPVDMEVLPPSTVQAMERAQVDNQVATAHQYPRDLAKFKQRATTMATIDVETAESCHYIRPVGRELDKATGRWVDKYAEGPSIRAAEIVAVSYGNLRVKSFIVEQTERYVRCEGQAWDLESNFAASVQATESTVTKKGEPYSERQRTVVAKALLAKVYRDVAFKVVPRALCKTVLDAAKQVAAKSVKSIEERRAAAKSWISKLKIDNAEARVLAAMNASSWEDMGVRQFEILRGLINGIQDGENTYEECFPEIETETKGPATPPPPIAGPTTKAATTVKAAAPTAKPAPPAPATKPAAKPAVATTMKAPTKAAVKPAAKPAPAPAPEPEPEPEPQPEDTGVEPQPEPQAEGEPEQGQPETVPHEAQGEGEPEATAEEQPAPETTPIPEPVDIDQIDDPKQLVAAVTDALEASGVTLTQAYSYLRKLRVMRPDQKSLSELLSAKLKAIYKNIPSYAPSMQKEPS